MVTKKLLIGGTAAVGSVATVAVVKNQYDKPAPDNREKVINWLKNKKTEGKHWEIKFKDCEEIKELKDIDPKGLPEYLSKNNELLESITSSKRATFTFRKNKSGDWENVFDKKQILAWVKNTSGDRATLKLGYENQTKELDFVKDLNKFFETLEKEKTLFNSGLENYSKNNRKTILFEKYLGGWYHTKTAIKKWGNDNNFEIKITKDNTEIENENDLVGLMFYFGSEEIQWKLSTYKKSKDKITWIFEKKDGWKSTYSQNTINNLVNNISDKKTSLKLYDEKGDEKSLSDIGGNELKQLFDAIVEKESLFRKDLEGYDEKNKKTVIFEKYKGFYDEEGQATWTHIKVAINDLMVDISGKIKWDDKKEQVKKLLKERKTTKEMDDNLVKLLKHMRGKKVIDYKIKVKTESSPSTPIEISKAKDNELIGLVKYLKGKKSDYKNKLQNDSASDIVLKKKSGSSSNEWEEESGGS